MMYYALYFFFFFKQKTAYEMRISDWSSDVCSSDLADDILNLALDNRVGPQSGDRAARTGRIDRGCRRFGSRGRTARCTDRLVKRVDRRVLRKGRGRSDLRLRHSGARRCGQHGREDTMHENRTPDRSEEHTSELQSLMRSSYAVFCLNK